MKKNETETRGRPRDEVYEGIAEDIKACVRKQPKKRVHEWVYDILKRNTKGPETLRSRYLGFRQSTTYKELKAFLKEKGYLTSLFFDGTDVTIRVMKV